jgi:hypothetical protein
LFTPTTGFIGTTTFQYRITDSGTPQASDTALVSVYVFKPIHNAVNDNTTSLKNAVVTGNASSNDNIVSGSTYSIIGTATKGTITITSAGNFTYTPNANAIGTDSVRYQVCSPSPMNICDTAKLFFAINSINAVDDLDTTTINTPKTITVKTNDNDPQGNTISNPIIVSNPSNGTVSVNANGTILFTPTTGFVGTTTFQYRITDNGTPQASDTALVSVYVYKPEFRAIPDINTSIIGSSISGNVSTNDVYFNGTTFTKIGNPLNGSIIFNANGSYIYTPNINFSGKDKIDYVITSPPPMNLKDSASISFVILNEFINGTNTIVAQNDNITTLINQSISICVLCNDNDPQNDSILGPVIVSNPSHGTISINSNKTISYTPNSNFVGSDKFSYSICDNNTVMDCDTATVFIEVSSNTSNQTFANDDMFFTIVDFPIVNNLSKNDSDPQGNTISFSKVSNPIHGTVIVNSNGSFNYIPNSNFSGPDYFIYSKCDNGTPSACDTATVYFNMLKLNTALPVVLKEFSVLVKNCEANLIWKTESEINFSNFEIERKINENEFIKIGEVFAKGSTNSSQQYYFNDNNISSSLYQYRLKMNDIDGKYSYSEIESIQTNCSLNNSILIYPNPAIDEVNLEISNEENVDYEIKILDIYGKIIYQNSISINAEVKSIKIPLNNFSNGIYSVILFDGTNKKVVKLYKTN